jgi:microcin C transport system substrate-binding protein
MIFARCPLAALIVALSLVSAAHADDQWRTVSSLIGTSKYGDSFQHYEYVNPDAPKGGTFHYVATGTFDSFNPFIVRGTAAAGLNEFGGYLYDTLMRQSTDEPGTSYPLIADAFKYPPDFSSATYRIDKRAKWQDGTPITAEDVVWSFKVLKANSPVYTRYFANVTDAVAISDHEVEFHFNQKGNRELPHILGDLVVLPKHWWEGTGASGKKRDITQPTLEPPLGSGPYKIESFKPGSRVVWKRVPDYWAAKLGVNDGRYNFDRMVYTYFTDENAAWQAFTKGGVSDFRMENQSARWATGYTFPAFKAGDVVKKSLPAQVSQFMQAYVMNLRRPQFQDRRVREALTYAFDFESMNRTLFYGLYKRTESYFVGSDLASSGLPTGKELEILNTVRSEVPPEVFTKPFKLPVDNTPQEERANLRHAFELLKQAGWEMRGGKLVNGKTGQPFRIEFLGRGDTDERITTPFIQNLKRLGIDARLRIVDPVQYVNRVRNFDFDMLAGATFPQSASPGNEQRDYWSSAAAGAPGSRNLMGIKNPAVDKLVNRVIFATGRDDLIAATHALDRVLLWNYYTIPQWNRPEIWVAYWNKFGIPAKQPAYVGVDTDSWWIDNAKEAALAKKYASQN